jgi:hypothetical protein
MAASAFSVIALLLGALASGVAFSHLLEIGWRRVQQTAANIGGCIRAGR